MPTFLATFLTTFLVAFLATFLGAFLVTFFYHGSCPQRVMKDVFYILA